MFFILLFLFTMSSLKLDAAATIAINAPIAPITQNQEHFYERLNDTQKVLVLKMIMRIRIAEGVRLGSSITDRDAIRFTDYLILNKMFQGFTRKRAEQAVLAAIRDEFISYPAVQH